MALTKISIGAVDLGDEADVRALFREVAGASEEDFPETLRAFVKRLRIGAAWMRTGPAFPGGRED